MAMVMLILANGPGFPEGSTEHRHEITLTLDSTDLPDAAAWAADPADWPASRVWPGEPDMRGDVQFDADGGWSLRFFGRPGDAADAPNAALLIGPAPVRPGQHVTIREPNGVEYVWRVVNVGQGESVLQGGVPSQQA